MTAPVVTNELSDQVLLDIGSPDEVYAKNTQVNLLSAAATHGATLSQYLFIFMTSLTTALIMVPLLRKWALSVGAVDVPDARKIHTGLVPRNGGVAIFLAFLFALLVNSELEPASRGILTGALIIFITGFCDDLRSITPRLKFLGEIIGCLMTMVVGNLYITNLGDLFGFGVIVLPLWLAIPFTLFAVVGVINAVNLIDGLDGLAGGLSVIALGSFFILGWDAENATVMLLCAALLGALLGFLKYNYYPARVFMGDTGSLVVGFVLGFLAILLTQTSGGEVNPVLPVLILGVPIIDTVWVMTSRITRKKSPFAPDMTHVHHKFLDLGMEHRFTVIVIYLVSLFWSVVSLLFHRAPGYLLLYTYVAGSLSFYLGLRFILQNPQRFHWLKKDSTQGLRQTNLYRRLVAVADCLQPVLLSLYLLYLACALRPVNDSTGQPWWLYGLLFSLGLILLAWTRNEQFSLVRMIFYLSNLVLAFNIETYSSDSSFELLSFNHLSDWVFLPMAALFVFRILLKREKEFYLGGAELLSLGLAVFAGIVISNLTPSSELLTVLFKGMLLIMVSRLIISYRAPYRRAAFAVTLAVLLIGVLQRIL